MDCAMAKVSTATMSEQLENTARSLFSPFPRLVRDLPYDQFRGVYWLLPVLQCGRMSEPSKVIHIRNVGHEIAESDLLQLLQPFGVVSKIVMLRAKNQVGEGMFTCSSHLTKSLPQTRARMEGILIRFVILCLTDAGFQALIQFHSRQEAVEAFGSLHVIIYIVQLFSVNCKSITTTTDLVPLSFLRDFTNPSLPTEQRPRASQQAYPDPANLYAFQQAGASYAQMGRAAMIAAAFGGTLPHGVTGTNERCTLIVSNLNNDKIDEDKLFNLFSLYGNIVRIKVLRNKPDHALVEMADGLQAELAVHYLKGAILFGKKLEVNYSKYPNITPAPDAHDYLNSSLNRFNSNMVKNYRHCCSPTKMIHISALPQEISEEAILNHLSEHGTVVNTKLFEVNGKRQALVLFETEEAATEALVSKHASTLEGNTIRISFSQMQSI
ncbi:Polypyrimidine tract-binding protein homolog 3 [Zea mays]|uniref:Polypyrimidine tract-binding protein homolog 3 n=1 Tax=Zea mays TaxID=4577 RepID=A0A1D6M5G5_MAIZE|nr:Polypyrimidine tract-binding protein homolog 3 [Zea mays]